MWLQVLETGIAFHSVLIGIALGVSNSPCTIRPLLAALTFHQFFEGVALGSCLMQVSPALHSLLLRHSRRAAKHLGNLLSGSAWLLVAAAESVQVISSLRSCSLRGLG